MNKKVEITKIDTGYADGYVDDEFLPDEIDLNSWWFKINGDRIRNE